MTLDEVDMTAAASADDRGLADGVGAGDDDHGLALARLRVAFGDGVEAVCALEVRTSINRGRRRRKVQDARWPVV